MIDIIIGRNAMSPATPEERRCVTSPAFQFLGVNGFKVTFTCSLNNQNSLMVKADEANYVTIAPGASREFTSPKQFWLKSTNGSVTWTVSAEPLVPIV